LLVGAAGWWIARWKRVPFVFEVRDLWPESLAAVGVGQENSALHRVLGAIAGFLYRHSQKIVVVTPAFKEHLIRHWAVPPEKIAVVENGVETDLFAPENVDPGLRKELGIENRFVACYVGTMGLAHGLDTLVEAAEKLQRSCPDAMFLLVGEGADKERVRALAVTRGLRNLLFVDQQPRERIPAFINASDVCLVLLKKTELFKTVIPTKMLEFLSCAKPVILGVEGQARQLMEGARGGIAIEPENADALVRAMERLENAQEEREAMGRSGRTYVLERCSRGSTAKAYLEVLETVVDANRTSTSPNVTGLKR
jgi:glycosyltransferase involved in cell wall biosynthesis